MVFWLWIGPCDMTEKFNEHPFYKPLWRRIVIVVITGLWLAQELWMREPMWGVIAAGFFGVSVWQFIIIYPRGKDT